MQWNIYAVKNKPNTFYIQNTGNSMYLSYEQGGIISWCNYLSVRAEW